MTIKTEVFPTFDYPAHAADVIGRAWPNEGSVVITGGTTVAPIYKDLMLTHEVGVFFSDERCVPPDHADSNFRMANDAFLDGSPARVHRMPGELDPEEGADRYHEDVASSVEAGFDLMLLGMGADCHIGALFPGSPALDAEKYCAAVDRPDGLKGLTLTPPAMLAAKKVLLLVTGEAKAEAVARVVKGDEDPTDCPARLLADHPDVIAVLDEAAASRL